MAFIGFVKSPYGPGRTYEEIIEKLKEMGFTVEFSKHHWAGDLPFGLVMAETNKGPVAIRWSLGKEFSIRLEAVDEETYDGFVEDTLEYINADSG
ncbi:hypothetical protein E3E36_10455 [Thermococcus sp. M36]|uniref:hypothetical protein n=1 Tax=Thermococcus sp. M36 TaxID=1638261 RepID=UPI00143C6328|nr:hypothetical protein [Thermococcus sp. M36]NJE06548.1 hypothetical protein [Thermococcus sp. M36]